MKRLLCLTAAFSLAATAASAQFQEGMPVVFKDKSTADADSRALAEMVYRTLDKSRYLHPVPILEDTGIELEAPISLVKEANGTRVTVRFQITPYRGTGREYTANCTSTQLQRCADAIVLRAERLSRESKLDAEANRPLN